MICYAIKNDSFINYILNCYFKCILVQQTWNCVPHRFWFHKPCYFHLYKLQSVYHNDDSWHLKCSSITGLKNLFLFISLVFEPQGLAHMDPRIFVYINLNINILLILQTILRKQALNRCLVILLIGIFQLKISFIGAKLNPYLQEPSMVRSKRIWRVWRYQRGNQNP
jgi:hypothetical protein